MTDGSPDGLPNGSPDRWICSRANGLGFALANGSLDGPLDGLPSSEPDGSLDGLPSSEPDGEADGW